MDDRAEVGTQPAIARFAASRVSSSGKGCEGHGAGGYVGPHRWTCRAGRA